MVIRPVSYTHLDALLALGKNLEATVAYKTALQLQKYNDIGIYHSYIQSLLATNDIITLQQLKPDIDATINMYQLAIMQGAHHTGLSRNVEELIELLETMKQQFPTSASMYNELANAVEAKAKKDRDFVVSRTPGLLW